MIRPVYILTVNGSATPPMRIGFTIREVANGRNRINLKLVSKTGTPPIAVSDTITLTEDGVLIFGGTVDEPTEAGAGGQPISKTETAVSAIDFNALAERRVCNIAFNAGTLKSQLQQLMTVFGTTGPGVSLDVNQVDGPAMLAWVAAYWRVDDVLNQLTTLSGGYLWDISYARVLRMHPPTSDAAPVNVTDSNRVALGDVTVRPSLADYANRVLLLFGDGLHDATENFTGDGSRVAFQLTNFVAGNRGYVTVAGVNEPIGVTAPPYWVLSQAGIAWTMTRSSPPPAGAAISITYTGQFPTLTYADAPGGIPTPPGIWEVLLRAPETFDAGVAYRMALDEVTIRSARPRTITYRTQTRGIHPGQAQTITNAARHLAGVGCLISEVAIVNGSGVVADRMVTAVEGSRFPGTWRDMIKGWNDVGTSIGPGATGISGGGGGAPIGPGTIGKLAKWITTASIGDSLLAESGATVTATASIVATLGFIGDGSGLTNLNASTLATGTVAPARLPQFTGGDVTTAGPGSVNLQLGAGVVGAPELAPNAVTGAAIADGAITSAKIADGTITNVDVSPSAAIDWTKINKTGATFGDIGGSIAWTQLPTGAGTWTGTPTITGSLTVSAHLYGISPYSQDVGQLTKKFRAIHAAELWVETIVAQSSMATIGGRLMVGTANILARDVAAGDTTIYLKYATPLLHVAGVEFGSKLIFESAGKFEIMYVTSQTTPAADAGDGSFPFIVQRAAAGTASAWFAGDSVLDTGKTGSAFIDLFSIRGVNASTQSGPTITGNVRLTGAAGDWAPRWTIGNLRGTYGYSVDRYGFGAGDFAAANIVIDAVDGVRIRSAGTVYAQMAGSLFTLGLPAGNRVQWDGANMTLVADTVQIDPATGIHITSNNSDGIYINKFGYTFTVPAGGLSGLYGYVSSGLISAWLVVQQTSTQAAKIGLRAQDVNGSSGAYIELLQSVTSTPSVGIGGGTSLVTCGNVLQAGGMIRAFGWANIPVTGLAVDIGISGGGGWVRAYDNTAGAYAVLNLAGSEIRIASVSNLTMAMGSAIYPGSINGLSNYQTAYYLASSSQWGLYCNTGLYVAGSLTAGAHCYLSVSSSALIFAAYTSTYIDCTPGRMRLVTGGYGVFWDAVHWATLADAAGYLGQADLRWITLFAVNGAINTSDAREKQNITPTIYGRAFLAALRPSDYEWRDASRGAGRYSGLIAQDVAAAAPDFGGVSYGTDGVASGLNYSCFIAPLVAGWQDHDARIAALERNNAHAE